LPRFLRVGTTHPHPPRSASGSSRACSRSSFRQPRAALVNNVTHWAYGILNGALYGLVAESVPKPRVGYGLPFGAAVWASDYVVLPAAKLYKPLWKYDLKTLAQDLSAHLVYGLATRHPRCGC